MRQLLISLLVVITSCTVDTLRNNWKIKQAKNNGNTVASITLNGSTKRNVGEATEKKLDAMAQLVSDRSYQNASERKEPSSPIKSKTDKPEKQCSMKGAEEDAMHARFGKTLKLAKELNEDKE